MTYWALNAVFLVPAAVVLVIALARRGRPSDQEKGIAPGPAAHSRKGVLAALGITAVVLLVLTAVFDNVMIAAGLFWYNAERISGAFIGSAPLEDFAYSLAAVLLLPALWMLLDRRPKTTAAASTAPAESPARPPASGQTQPPAAGPIQPPAAEPKEKQ